MESLPGKYVKIRYLSSNGKQPNKPEDWQECWTGFEEKRGRIRTLFLSDRHKFSDPRFIWKIQ